MSYVVLYLASAIIFLVIDVVWIVNVMRPIFERNVGDLLGESRLGLAAVFYLAYVLGVMYFASAKGLGTDVSYARVALDGAILGALAYGTYEFTNAATLRGWTLEMVAIDVTWGTVLTAVTAAGGLAVARALGY